MAYTLLRTQIAETVETERKKFSDSLECFRKNRFHLAVDYFKRNKNIFLNFLLSKLLLPTFAVPLTIIPSFIYFSLFRSVKLLYPNDEKEPERLELSLGEMAFFFTNPVTNRVNPNNPISVSHLEMFTSFTNDFVLWFASRTLDFVLRLVSFLILREGVHFVHQRLRLMVALLDTLGISLAFRHNTKVMLNFLSQYEAANFRVSAYPPIKFLKSVRFAHQRLRLIVRSSVLRMFRFYCPHCWRDIQKSLVRR